MSRYILVIRLLNLKMFGLYNNFMPCIDWGTFFYLSELIVSVPLTLKLIE